MSSDNHVHQREFRNSASPPLNVKSVAVAKSTRDVLSKITSIASTMLTVLLTGPSSSGKTFFARYLHAMSNRANQPLVEIDCGSIPDSLIESELFGHAKGAFTGAIRAKPGLVEIAGGGTLFIDEIGNLTPQGQSKLLRLLADKLIRPVGSTREIRVDVRVIAATNINLEDAVSSGSFRFDLYHRLSEYRLEIPPLSQRTDDIPALVRLYLLTEAERAGLPRKEFSDEALSLLKLHHWPGNIRELHNAINKLLIDSQGSVVNASDIKRILSIGLVGDIGLKQRTTDFQRQLIIEALSTSTSDSVAAEKLTVSLNALNSLKQRHRLSSRSLRKKNSSNHMS